MFPFSNIWAAQGLMWEEMITLIKSLDIWSSILEALKQGYQNRVYISVTQHFNFACDI